MLLRQFPDLGWLKIQAQARFANQRAIDGRKLPHPGWPTVVMQAKATDVVRDQIVGPLSIFTNRSGSSVVSAGQKRVTVKPDTFFITNAGQSYTLEIREKSPVETFNIHFGDHFVKSALSTNLTPAEKLLDNPAGPVHFGFYNRLEPVSPAFLDLLKQISESPEDGLLWEEQMFQLLTMLLESQGNLMKKRDRLTSIKKSTKEELMRRLIDVTDYLYAYSHLNPGLDELAQVSCLSKFHFLRLFKLAYGKTPHQFLSEIKVERSKALLRNSGIHIHQMAADLGFKNSNTFSRLFFRETGMYPSQYRLQG